MLSIHLFNIVAQGLGDVGKLIAKYHQSLHDGKIEESSSIQELIEQKDAWHYLHKIEAILNRFKLDPIAKLTTLFRRLEKTRYACPSDCSRTRPTLT